MPSVKLLLAEADRRDRGRLISALTEGRANIEVRAVSTAVEFRRLIRRHRFDCAVVNYHLGDTNALELLRYVTGGANECPVVVVSSGDDPAEVIACFRNGATDFVPVEEARRGKRLWRRVELAVRRCRNRSRQRRRSERRHRQLSRMAETDPLTGLYNRRYLTQQMHNGAYQRDRRRTMSCILMDLDHFKQVNDTYGHRAGDRVLRGLAREIRADLNGGDVALRWGGEEFLVLRPSTNLPDAWVWAEDLRRKFAGLTFRTGRSEFTVTVSLGVATLPTASMGYDSIDMADQALYLAKRLGRDRVCTWPMAVVDRALSDIETRHDQHPEAGRRQLLSACGNILGPTQIEHVTTHCRSVERTAAVLAGAMNLPAVQVERIRQAGLLHDLGKCVIPESMLAQSRPLTTKQWDLMHRRGDYAAEIGRRLGFDPITLSYVKQHNRVLTDRSVSGAISAGARVVAIADAVVAMRSDRAYRPARSASDIAAELHRCCHTEVDAAMVCSVCGAGPVAAA